MPRDVKTVDASVLKVIPIKSDEVQATRRNVDRTSKYESVVSAILDADPGSWVKITLSGQSFTHVKTNLHQALRNYVKDMESSIGFRFRRHVTDDDAICVSWREKSNDESDDDDDDDDDNGNGDNENPFE